MTSSLMDAHDATVRAPERLQIGNRSCSVVLPGCPVRTDSVDQSSAVLPAHSRGLLVSALRPCARAAHGPKPVIGAVAAKAERRTAPAGMLRMTTL